MHTQKSFDVVEWEPWNSLMPCLSFEIKWVTKLTHDSDIPFSCSFLTLLSLVRSLSLPHTTSPKKYKNQKFLAKSKEFVGKTLFKLNYKQRIAKKYEKREEERKNDVGAWTNWNQHTTTTETNKNGIIYK